MSFIDILQSIGNPTIVRIFYFFSENYCLINEESLVEYGYDHIRISILCSSLSRYEKGLMCEALYYITGDTRYIDVFDDNIECTLLYSLLMLNRNLNIKILFFIEIKRSFSNNVNYYDNGILYIGNNNIRLSPYQIYLFERVKQQYPSRKRLFGDDIHILSLYKKIDEFNKNYYGKHLIEISPSIIPYKRNDFLTKRKCYIYTFSYNDKTLYIGKTYNKEKRKLEHFSKYTCILKNKKYYKYSPTSRNNFYSYLVENSIRWEDLIYRYTKYECSKVMLDVKEFTAIRTFKPICNIIHNIKLQ